MSAPSLELEMTYRLQVRGPQSPRDGSPSNPRTQVWEMVSATLEGPRIHATSSLTGLDWFTPAAGAYGRPHVRLAFHTDDGALVLLDYHGIVEASAAFKRAVGTNGATAWSDQYMRMAMLFDTTSPRYQWLAQHLFVARGRLLAAYELLYEIYRVT